MDNAQKRCIYQVTVNQPLPDKTKAKYNVTSISDEQTSIKTTNGNGIETVVSLQELKDLACPMNCNNQGNCSKGNLNNVLCIDCLHRTLFYSCYLRQITIILYD